VAAAEAQRRRERAAEVERTRRPVEVTTRFDNWIKPAAPAAPNPNAPQQQQ